MRCLAAVSHLAGAFAALHCARLAAQPGRDTPGLQHTAVRVPELGHEMERQVLAGARHVPCGEQHRSVAVDGAAQHGQPQQPRRSTHPKGVDSGRGRATALGTRLRRAAGCAQEVLGRMERGLVDQLEAQLHGRRHKHLGRLLQQRLLHTHRPVARDGGGEQPVRRDAADLRRED